MRQTLAAIALAVLTGFAGWIYGTRHKIVHPDLPIVYDAALYSIHVQAVDAETGEPLHFEVRWDYEGISPYSKGSGPTREQVHADGSKSVHAVGVNRKEGLDFEISAAGYLPAKLHADPQTSGIVTSGSAQMEIVKLQKAPAP